MPRRRITPLCAFLFLAACQRPGPEIARAALPPPLPVVVQYGPWLLEPQPTQVTVAWTTPDESIGLVAYGETSLDHLARETAPHRDHRVLIEALEPARRYRFRLPGTAQEGLFWTAPPALDAQWSQVPFRVLVYGDNRTLSSAHAEVVRAAEREGARLALHTGDMVADANRADLWAQWFAIEHGLLSETPLVATVGNHELTDHGAQYGAHFQAAGLPPYRSLDYGPVHLLVLDSFEESGGTWPREGSISEAQRAWLQQDLLHTPKDRHVWVLVHQGPFSHPLVGGHGGSSNVKRALAPFKDRIEAIFAGHDHYYERGELEGFRYFVLGGGGAPLYEPNPKAEGVKVAIKSLSYAVIDVCGCHVDGTIKDAQGKTIDTFQLATCPQACPAAPQRAASAAGAPR